MAEKKKKGQKKKGLDVSQPLPAIVRDAKTGKTKKRKTAKLNMDNRAARGADLREESAGGKLFNDLILNDAELQKIFPPRAVRAGMKAADIKKKRNVKEMKAGGKVRGAGMAKKGVRKAKMVVMKGS